MIATTVIVFFVTPCDVAPPLLSPVLKALTHAAPFPSSVVSKRPQGLSFGSSGRQRGLSNAACVPMPEAATGGPAPSGRGIAAAPAALAFVPTTSDAAVISPATASDALRPTLRRTVFMCVP